MIALFPGQGSQHVGMAKDFFDDFKIVKELFEEASDSVGRNIAKLCFDGPESDLKLTENTQPCLLTASVAAFRVAESEIGFKPAAFAGHSLGEYSALVAAGSLPFAAAVRWVHERGRAMQTAVPTGEGGMAAILNMEEEPLKNLCQEAVEVAKKNRDATAHAAVPVCLEPANFNSPGQIVVAGSTDALAKAGELIKEGKFSGKFIPLEVSAPFHSSLMRPAREKMAELFSNADRANHPKTPSAPYLPNRTARPTSEAGVVFELLVEQVDHPVLWQQSMQTAIAQGWNRGIEFGPGKVLQGLAKRIAKKEKQSFEVFSLSGAGLLPEFESFCK